MRGTTMAAALLVLGAGGGLLAMETTTGTSSTLTVRGGSTLRSWSCSTTEVNGVVRTETTAEGSVVAGLPAGRHAVALTIPVASIDCRNGTMNGHMRRALRAERQPEIRFEMTRYTMDAAGGVNADGNLTVAGRTTPIRIAVVVQPAADGVRVSGSVDLRMTELGVEPPSLMLGTLKVHDPVTIEFDVHLPQQAVSAAAR